MNLEKVSRDPINLMRFRAENRFNLMGEIDEKRRMNYICWNRGMLGGYA
jgi:translation initiation factor IF-1